MRCARCCPLAALSARLRRIACITGSSTIRSPSRIWIGTVCLLEDQRLHLLHDDVGGLGAFRSPWVGRLGLPDLPGLNRVALGGLP